LAFAGPASAGTTDHPYVALGDSISVGLEASSPEKSFVGLLFPDYQASLGANVLLNRAQSGASSTALRNNGQLTTALADINAPSDTRAVTIEIGGADGLFGPCAGHWDDPGTCPFRANYAEILGELQTALEADPGAESFKTMAYYNPSTGKGDSQEASRDNLLLGDNLTVGCSDSGANAGLNDAIFQEAGKLGVPVANTYPAFKQAGQAFISQTDPLHIHPNDAGYAAIAKAFHHVTTPCGASPDRNPPETKITKGPSGKTSDRTPTFKFHSSEAGSTFKCSLDGGPNKFCVSARTLPKLSFGRHVFNVAATDAAGNTDPEPASASFKVVR
jgi:lysophospholipase L1-like esterase